LDVFPETGNFLELMLRHGLGVCAIILHSFCRAPEAKPQDDGIFMTKFPARMIRRQIVAELPLNRGGYAWENLRCAGTLACSKTDLHLDCHF
jgi:hypothetical protein